MPHRPRPLTVLYFGLWTTYFAWFWWHAFHYDAAGNLIAGNANMWADWALHFTLGNVMVERDLFPAMSPLLIDRPFSYPFAADLLSALLMKAGMGMVPAFVLPGFLSSLLLVAALFYFLKTLFRSEAVAVVGATLFLLGGGLGFLDFVRDVAASPEPFATLFNPPHEYTRLDGKGIVLLSVIDSMIIPQRSFTLGFPLALIALGLIHTTLMSAASGARLSWPRLVVAALILGSLPVVHTHSLLAAFVILACWAAGAVLLGQGDYWQRLKPWFLIALVTSLLALPLIAFFISHAVSGGFLRWLPGWYANELNLSWPGFWLNNWGLMPLLAVAGLGLWLAQTGDRREQGRAVFVFAPFFVLFALVNLFVFAPWLWDNTKLLVWAGVGLSGLAAWFCVRLWQDAAAWPRQPGQAGIGVRLASWGVRLAVIVALAASVASGGIDAYRVLRTDLHSHVLYTAEDFRLADWAKRETDPRSVWLTGDRHNHWLINLTGRQPLMAYRGWLWSHGYDIAQIERDIGQMYASADPALLARYRVDYAVIGPDERENWRANEGAFAGRFPEVQRSGNYTVYRVAP